MSARLRIVRRVLGWAGLVFFAFLIADEAVEAIAPNSRLYAFISACTNASGAWLVVRLFRLAIRRGIWRLRNRLLAAYLFMAVVPILLIATLAVLGARAVASQLAVYLVTSELDRRIEGLQLLGQSLAQARPGERRVD